jgi:hypothetical protein
MSIQEIAPLLQERRDLLSEIVTELTTYGQLTSTPVAFDVQLFEGAAQFYDAFQTIIDLTDGISKNIDQFIEEKRKSAIEQALVHNHLLEEHTILKRQLHTVKAMSKSVSSRAVALKNQRLAPILEFIWEATNKTANAQKLSEDKEFCATIFEMLNRADSRDSVLAALGILVNLSASEKGLVEIAESISRSAFQSIPKIAEVCHVYGEPRTLHLAIFFIHNMLRQPGLAFQLIRENCVQWIGDFLHSVVEPSDRIVLIGILETLITKRYEKTIRYCCKDSLLKLATELDGQEFVANINKKAELTGDPEEGKAVQLKQPARFGFPRVYH